MEIRELNRDEIEQIWQIDRREVIDAIYYWIDGQLVLRPEHYDMQGWPPGEAEKYTPILLDSFDQGGIFFGAFEQGRLIGAAVLENEFIGQPRDQLQLSFLHVSRDDRGKGVGRRLFKLAEERAKKIGARRLYISATPSEHTVNFYLRLGCVVTAHPDPGLFAREPEDIHLEYSILNSSLEADHDPEGFTGQWLFIGRKAPIPVENLSIRAAEISDAQAICEVYLASRKRFLPYALPAHTDEEVCQYISQVLIPRWGTYVAIIKGAIVGMMALSKDDRYSWIDQLYLHPDWVGGGIGTKFLERAKTELGPPIRLYTFQANLAARRFYKRHGFRAIAFTDGEGNEEKCPDVLYEWAP